MSTPEPRRCVVVNPSTESQCILTAGHQPAPCKFEDGSEGFVRPPRNSAIRAGRIGGSLERIANDLNRIAAVAEFIAAYYIPKPPAPMAYCPSCNAPEFWSVRPEPGDQVKCANCQQVHAFPFYTAPAMFTWGSESSTAEQIKERFDASQKRGKYPPDNLADYGAPIGAPVPHSFARVPDNRFCGECGGGKLHPIHHAEKLIDPQTQIQLDPGLSDYLSNKAKPAPPLTHCDACRGIPNRFGDGPEWQCPNCLREVSITLPEKTRPGSVYPE